MLSGIRNPAVYVPHAIFKGLCPSSKPKDRLANVMDYNLNWEIDTEAESPSHAVAIALEI